MIIYIYDGALYFPFCLSCVLYFYYTFFSIFVTKMGRYIKRMRSQSNTKGKGDLGDISRQKNGDFYILGGVFTFSGRYSLERDILFKLF